MSRLTVKWKDKLYDLFDPVDIADNEYSKINFKKVITKLGEYEDLEEQGLLLKPPCIVGDIVYEIAYIYDEYEILKMRVQDISSNKRDVYLYVVNTNEDSDYNNSISITEFGKDLFLTKEEAEKELKRLENEQCKA